jgi:hypothetical protein
VYGLAVRVGCALGGDLCVRGDFLRWIHGNFQRCRRRKLPPICRCQLPADAPSVRFARVMWGSMVILIPATGVTRAAAAPLARALGGVHFVVVERTRSTDTDRRNAALDHCTVLDRSAPPDQGSAAAESEAIARQLPAGVLAYEVVLVGQGDGAQVAIELAHRLEQPGVRDSGLATGGVSAVVVAGAAPPTTGESSRSLEPGPEPERAPAPEPIAAPLHVWAAAEDLSAPAGQNMLGWHAFTDAPTTFRSFDGSAADFLLTQVAEVAEQLQRVLAVSSASEVLDVS